MLKLIAPVTKKQTTLTAPEELDSESENVPQLDIYQPQQLPLMPKVLTASLPVFDGKAEKFKLFEDIFRTHMKMYPHLTEIQKVNYFHTKCTAIWMTRKKDNLKEVITAFKRRFGDFQSSAKARCECKRSVRSRGQKFIDTSIYAKMPNQVKKNLNRLISKPHYFIALHLEREIRLIGLGALDETTLVPVNSVDLAPPETKKEPNQ